MKNSTYQIIFIIIFSILSLTLFSQSPNAIKYQGVVRDASGDIIKSQAVSFQFKIHDGSSSGPVVYTETHSVNTNNYGIVSLEIGRGSTSDVFGSVNWGDGDKYLEILLDKTGGSSFMTMGAFQMVSVPYAMYANETGSVADNSIETSKIQDNAVTLEKLNNSGASSGDVLMFDGSSLTWGTVSSSDGDITSVTAGDGLTGGALSNDATLNIGAGSGITVNTDNIELNEAYTNSLYVNEAQANSVSTPMIQDGAVTTEKVSSSGATSGQVLSYNGTSVEWATPSASGGNTLDQAYDEGGLGAGRIINATNGAVHVTGSGGISSDAGLSIGMNSSTDDDAITFDYGTTPEYLMWDNSESQFYLSDDLRVLGTIGNASTTFPYNTMFDAQTAPAPSSGEMSSAGDLYIEFDLEVGDDLYVGGNMMGRVPGITTQTTTTVTSVSNSGTTNLTSVTINAPGPGYVIVTATAIAGVAGTSIGNIIATIETSSSTSPGVVSRAVFGSSNESVSPSTVRWGNLNTQRFFVISAAGSHTYYFNASRGYTGGTASVSYPTMTCMYFGTSHGTVDVSIASPVSSLLSTGGGK